MSGQKYVLDSSCVSTPSFHQFISFGQPVLHLISLLLGLQLSSQKVHTGLRRNTALKSSRLALTGFLLQNGHSLGLSDP